MTLLSADFQHLCPGLADSRSESTHVHPVQRTLHPLHAVYLFRFIELLEILAVFSSI